MKNVEKLPTSFLQLRKKRIEEALEKIPKLSLGKRDSIPVIREYYFGGGRMRSHEYLLSGKKGVALMKSLRQKEDLTIQRNELIEIIRNRNDAADDIKLEVDCMFDSDYWNSIVLRADIEASDYSYEYNGIKMSSRAEVVIAQTLDSMGLEFRYEPLLMIRDKIYYPDFIIFLPEFGRCFYIEFMGKLDDLSYAHINAIKIADYLNYGMVINKDLLLLCGTRSTMASEADIAEDVCAVINKYCRMYCRY